MNNISYKGPQGGSSLIETQYLSASITSGNLTLQRTISSVDTTKSIIVIDAVKGTALSESEDVGLYAEFVNATTIELKRNGSGTNADIRYRVITFNNAKSVQSGYNAKIDANITITAVREDKVLLFNNYMYEFTGTTEIGFARNGSIELTTPTNIKVTDGGGANFANFHQWWVVEFK